MSWPLSRRLGRRRSRARLDLNPRRGPLNVPGVAPALTPDDVVYLDDLWLPWVDTQFREDRCEALAKCGHLLWRVPDLADPMLITRPEANLELQSVSRKDAFLVQPTYRVVEAQPSETAERTG